MRGEGIHLAKRRSFGRGGAAQPRNEAPASAARTALSRLSLGSSIEASDDSALSDAWHNSSGWREAARAHRGAKRGPHRLYRAKRQMKASATLTIVRCESSASGIVNGQHRPAWGCYGRRSRLLALRRNGKVQARGSKARGRRTTHPHRGGNRVIRIRAVTRRRRNAPQRGNK